MPNIPSRKETKPLKRKELIKRFAELTGSIPITHLQDMTRIEEEHIQDTTHEDSIMDKYKSNIREDIHIYDPGKNKMVFVGYVLNSTFYKKVVRSKHYLRVVSGYALQEEILDILKDKYVKEIVIEESDTGSKMGISMEEFEKHHGKWSHNHGIQLTISEKYLSILEV